MATARKTNPRATKALPRSLAHRLRSVRLVLSGKSRSEVARLYGDSFGIVARWVRRYEAGGTDGLRTKPMPGRTPLLTPSQLSQLRRFVKSRSNPTTGPEAAAFIKKHFGYTITRQHARRMLRDL